MSEQNKRRKEAASGANPCSKRITFKHIFLFIFRKKLSRLKEDFVEERVNTSAACSSSESLHVSWGVINTISCRSSRDVFVIRKAFVSRLEWRLEPPKGFLNDVWFLLEYELNKSATECINEIFTFGVWGQKNCLDKHFERLHLKSWMMIDVTYKLFSKIAFKISFNI